MTTNTTRPPIAGELLDKGFRGAQFDSLAEDERRNGLAAEQAAAEEAANRERNREWRENLERLFAGPADGDPASAAVGTPTPLELFARGVDRNTWSDQFADEAAALRRRDGEE